MNQSIEQLLADDKFKKDYRHIYECLLHEQKKKQVQEQRTISQLCVEKTTTGK